MNLLSRIKFVFGSQRRAGVSPAHVGDDDRLFALPRSWGRRDARPTFPVLRVGSLIFLLLALAGCGRNEVKVYRLTKEPTAPPQAQAQPAQMEMQPAPAQPPLTWSLPVGWREVPRSEMRAASFVASGRDGQTAEVAVIPLPSGGSEMDLVNMWRQTMHLPPLSADNMTTSEPVTIGSDQGKLFDIASEDLVIDGKSRGRILVATVTRGPMNWFFKMTGEEAFVKEQKPVFLQFLKSISFSPGETQMTDANHPAGTTPMTTAEVRSLSEGTADPNKPAWTVPQGWQDLPPGQMLAAKFLISTNNGMRTEVNVGTAMGGMLANVNRWRGQLGVAPVSEDALKGEMKSVDVDGGKALFVDLNGTDARTGRPARILGGIVSRGDETWFYKMMGDPQVVEQQKETFTKFVQTVKYPHAH